MPFDALPSPEISTPTVEDFADLVILRVACDGVAQAWRQGELGTRDANSHCAIGWLLAATDWDTKETTRLALRYLYPALPPIARPPRKGRMEAIWQYNDSDNSSQQRMIRLFNDAITLAEQAKPSPV